MVVVVVVSCEEGIVLYGGLWVAYVGGHLWDDECCSVVDRVS